VSALLLIQALEASHRRSLFLENLV